MGFTSEEHQSAGGAAEPTPLKHPNFGQRVMGAVEKRYPIASTLLEQVFGTKRGLEVTPAQPAIPPDPGTSMPDGSEHPDTDFLGMNAQPKTGGLKALLQFLA
jgi:hypothetical protein